MKPLTLNTDHFAANVPSVDDMVLVPSQPSSDACGGTEATADTMKEVNMIGSGEHLIDNENIDDG